MQHVALQSGVLSVEDDQTQIDQSRVEGVGQSVGMIVDEERSFGGCTRIDVQQQVIASREGDHKDSQSSMPEG